MKIKLKKVFRVFISIIFWLSAWTIASCLVNNSFLLPGIDETLEALRAVISDVQFPIIVLSTLLRVVVGLIFGIVLGILLAVLCYHFKIAASIIAPIISVIKSTPVASFIIILWILMSGDALTVFIALLMVMPIIWQNVMDGYRSIDNNLSEVCAVYGFNFFKRQRILVFPHLLRYIIPAVITASGLAWKSEIAAEIIAYTARSIGQQINDSRFDMDTPTVFAWTLIIITLSVVIELGTKAIFRRCEKWLSS